MVEGEARRALPVRNVLDGHVDQAPELTVLEVLESPRPFVRTSPLYQHRLPRHFGFWAAGMLPAEAGSASPGLCILHSRDIELVGHSGVLVFGDGWVDDAQTRLASYGCEHDLLRRDDDVITAPTALLYLAGRWFVGFNPGHINYAHWMTDQVPVLVAYRDIYAAEGLRLLLPEVGAGHFIRQTLDILGIPESQIFWLSNEVYRIDEIVFGSYIPLSAIPQAVVQCLQGMKIGLDLALNDRRRRLFLSRSESPSRRLLNEEAVVRALAPYGVERIVPGRMSLKEQISALDSAEVVVAPHGAGLVNVGFCRPGSVLIEIFSEYTVHPEFWTLSSLTGLGYGFVSGTSFDQDQALWDYRGSWHAPYIVDPTQVVHAVHKAIDHLSTC